MGSFTFNWEHPAEDVYVTGTFDNWSKSVKLEKSGSVFSKTVDLPESSEKIYYKFVVDGNWTTDHTAPQENDSSGNLNNVLTPERYSKPTTTMSGPSGDLPGTFPETPAVEGEFSVKPIPATEGYGNPIKLAPGEKVPDPSEVTTNSIDTSVKLDKESYDKPDRFVGAPVLPDVVTPQTERDQNGTGVLDMPGISKQMIPESSLPMGTGGEGTYNADATIQSAGPATTTSALAGKVPLESKATVPEVVKESQEQAGFAPEASADPTELKEKSAVEDELLKEVPEAPSTSEGTAGKGTDKSEKTVTASEAAAAVGAAAVAAGGAATAAALAAKDKAVETATTSGVNDYLPESVKQAIPATTTTEPPADGTPEIVKESLVESGQSPEAAANPEALAEKKAMEKELLSDNKPSKPDSRDISPRTVPGTHTQAQPMVTSGVATTETKETSTPAPTTEAPKNGTTTGAASSSKTTPTATNGSSAEDKKKKRRSFFGKLKDKLK